MVAPRGKVEGHEPMFASGGAPSLGAVIEKQPQHVRIAEAGGEHEHGDSGFICQIVAQETMRHPIEELRFRRSIEGRIRIGASFEQQAHEAEIISGDRVGEQRVLAAFWCGRAAVFFEDAAHGAGLAAGESHLEGAASPPVPGAIFRRGGEGHVYPVPIAGGDSKGEGVARFEIAQVGARACIEQQPRRIAMPGGECIVKSGAPTKIGRIYISAGVENLAKRLGMAESGRQHERRDTFGIGDGGGCGIGFDEAASELPVAGGDRVEQRGAPECIGLGRAGRGRDEKLHQAVVAEGDGLGEGALALGEAEGCEAAFRLCGGQTSSTCLRAFICPEKGRGGDRNQDRG